jgi:ATP-binding cassette subfamily F protein uup
MDEPTNDLDIETLELLEELIDDFDGTILLVSHDRVFLDHIVTSTLAFEGDGRVTEYVGGYEDYVRQSKAGSGERGAGGRDAGSTTTPVGSGPAASRPSREERSARSRIPAPGSPLPGKLTFKEARELESLPARIEVLEVEQARLRAQAGSPEFYKESPEKIRKVLARIDALEPELEAAVARWAELEGRS